MKTVLIVLPYPLLITSGIEVNFEATMSLIKRLNQILQSGLRPTFASKNNDGVQVVKNSFLRSEFEAYLRHYHDVSGTYDVTSLFRKDTGDFRIPFSAENLMNVFCYGNVFEFVFHNIQVDELAGTMRTLDYWGNQLFSSFVNRKMYETYFGKQILNPHASDIYFLHPILTTYFAVLIAENTEEFQSSVKTFQQKGNALNTVIEDSVAIGSYAATNFRHEPFFNINVNPVLINLARKDYYKLQDVFGSIFYHIVAIGELYNTLSILTDAHELCAMTRYSIPTELYEKVGMLKINPVTDLANIYGLRDFRKFEKTFRLGLTEDINYFRSYGSKASKIMWKKEALAHFSGITEALGLIDAFIVHLPEKTIFENEKQGKSFVANIYKSFESDFKDFMETLEDWVKDVSQVIEGARTTVQLNLAIVTLFWTLLFTVVLSPDVRSWLMSLISYLRSPKNPLVHFWS